MKKAAFTFCLCRACGAAAFPFTQCTPNSVFHRGLKRVTRGNASFVCSRGAPRFALHAETATDDEQITLLEYISQEIKDGVADAELLALFASLQAACKQIAYLVRRAAIVRLTGVAAASRSSSGGVAVNASGDKQKKLDVVANDVLKLHLARSRSLAVLASEEEGEPLPVAGSGKYVAVFDPLDGSSNIDASIPTGTIFGIYEATASAASAAAAAGNAESACQTATEIAAESAAAAAKSDVLQPGTALAAAGYCLYAAATLMVVTVGRGTHVFALDAGTGEFVLTNRAIRMPARGQTYSVNEARHSDWAPGLQRYIDDVKSGTGRSGRRYDLCYVCSLVADVHYTLFKGGIAMNPRNHLRLVYEGNPMAFVVEQAGGRASTGLGPILTVQPDATHQRIPVFLGSGDDIDELESYNAYGGVQQLGDKKYEV